MKSFSREQKGRVTFHQSAHQIRSGNKRISGIITPAASARNLKKNSFSSRKLLIFQNVSIRFRILIYFANNWLIGKCCHLGESFKKINVKNCVTKLPRGSIIRLWLAFIESDLKSSSKFNSMPNPAGFVLNLTRFHSTRVQRSHFELLIKIYSNKVEENS